jgi:BASS family bile acid:Na+ symporter
LVNVLISVFLALAMLCIGLAATLADARQALENPRRISRAIAANVLVAPLVAWGVISIVPMPDVVATVLLLLAFAPGGINAIQFTTKVPDRVAEAAGQLLVLSLFGLVVAPIAAGFILGAEAGVSVPYGLIAGRVALFMIPPLVIGVVLRGRVPELAEKLYKPAMLVSTLSFVAAVVISTSQRQEALEALGPGAQTGMIAFILAMMLLGWLAGAPGQDERQLLAVSTNLRSVGLV